MIIEGISPLVSGKVYGVYNPIRVRVVTTLPHSFLQVDFSVSGQAKVHNYSSPLFYSYNNEFEIELNQWLQLFFTGFNSLPQHNGTQPQQPNANYKEVVLNFSVIVKEGEGEGEEEKEIIKEYDSIPLALVNGYVPGGKNYYPTLPPQPPLPSRFWQGYPFSILGVEYSGYTEHWTTNGTDVGFFDILPPEDRPQLSPSKNCEEVYLCWLAPNTGYHYWLFPFIEESNTTKDTGTQDRWFLTEEQETENSLGLSLSREFTLIDKVPKKYWELLNTLFTSPEVYRLKKPPHQEQYTPTHWQRVRIKGQNHQNKSYENAKTYSINFYYPQQYTQTY